MRAMTLISTVGLVGLAIGPTTGGFVLAIAPWQVLLLVNVPIAVLAIIGVRTGIAADRAAELHRDPVDVPGAVLGTVTIVLALVAPTLFVNEGTGSWTPWAATAAAVAGAVLFVLRERSARYPLLDLKLVAPPARLRRARLQGRLGAGRRLGYMVTLQLQLDWGWSPAQAALGMLPQVIVLIGGSVFVSPFLKRVGFDKAAWISAAAVVAGLAVYAVLGSFGYIWIAIALVLVAAGLRVNGVVAGTNVLRGLPENRTSIGSALVDTASEVATGVSIAATGTIVAAVFTGSIATSNWSPQQTSQFHEAITIAGLTLTAVAAALVGWGFVRTRGAADDQATTPAEESVPV